LKADPGLIAGDKMASYAQRTIPWAVAIGFIAGLTSDAVLGKLVGLDVVRKPGVTPGSTK
jgi:hypothetical protein